MTSVFGRTYYPAPLYADIEKRATDLLTKDFPSEKEEKKVAWTGTTANGVVFESSLVSKKDGSVFGTLAPKYKHAATGINFSGELTTKRDVKVEAKVQDVASVVGASATLTLQTQAAAKVSDPQQVFATAAVEYRHDNFAGNASVDFGKLEGSTVKAAASVGMQGFILGASTVYHVGVAELKELDTSLSYQAYDFDVTAYGKLRSNDGRNENTAGFKYFHAYNSLISVAGDVSVDLTNLSKTPRLTVATVYKPDSYSTMKLKADSDGKIGLSLQQKLNQNTRLTLATTVDANNLNGKNAAQFGATLNFTF